MDKMRHMVNSKDLEIRKVEALEKIAGELEQLNNTMYRVADHLENQQDFDEDEEMEEEDREPTCAECDKNESEIDNPIWRYVDGNRYMFCNNDCYQNYK